MASTRPLTDDEKRAVELAQTPSEFAYFAGRLTEVFGDEFTGLVRAAQQAVVADVIEAFATVNDFALPDYRRNIGVGNMANYAACQLIRFTR